MNKTNPTKRISIPIVKNYLPTSYNYKDKILIAEDIQACNIPESYEPTKCITIGICEKGKLRYDIDGHTVISEGESIIIQTYGQKISNLKVLSPSFSAKVILVNTENIPYFAENFCDSFSLSQKLLTTDSVALTHKEMNTASTFVTQIIDYLDHDEYNNKYGLALALTKVILQQTLSKKVLKAEKVDDKEDDDMRKKTFYNFTKLVEKIYMKQAPVSTYCKELQVSSSYLEKTVHKYTGKSPLKYIHLYLLNKICIMAECTDKKKRSIKAIAEYNHFSTTSALARFVKRELKMTLTKYRLLESVMQQSIIHDTIPLQIAP